MCVRFVDVVVAFYVLDFIVLVFILFASQMRFFFYLLILIILLYCISCILYFDNGFILRVIMVILWCVCVFLQSCVLFILVHSFILLHS